MSCLLQIIYLAGRYQVFVRAMQENVMKDDSYGSSEFSKNGKYISYRHHLAVL